MIVKHLTASNLQTLVQCPRRFFLDATQRVPQESEPLLIGKFVHAALERRLLKEEPPGIREMGVLSIEGFRKVQKMLSLDLNKKIAIDKIISVELPFEIILPEFGTKVGGRIDLIVNEDLPHVIDFKTSKTMKTEDEVEDDIQLRVYGVALKHIADSLGIDTSKGVRVSLYYLLYDQMVTAEYSLEELTETEDYLNYIWMLLTDQADDISAYEPRLSYLCWWCPYKYKCDSFMAEEILAENPLERFVELKIRKFLIDREEKELQQALLANEDSNEWWVKGYHLKAGQSLRKSLDIPKLAENLGVEARSQKELLEKLAEKAGIPPEELYVQKPSTPFIKLLKK